ncbi:VOC family protein [Paracraurococcus lichenis]|uniref:VOC family protein n=1 Tax=Paracraurococcus lichenis TaxID=3064888 RepID=A0ABT9E0B4_9PROT|nr:VOC family protein [Paracraurococcus sp. LOR1-02]MDO9709596.1 VOC family protein [Paracraurococcus sp. LOR1-02]
MPPVLDHLVLDVCDRMAEGAARMEALGFQLTPMGKHSLGSANHLAVLAEDYLELLGTDVPGGALRPDIASYPVGLNGLVFRTEDAATLSAALVSRGVPALPAQEFHRPVDLPDGTRDEARFRTTRLDRAAAMDGRIYWCEHLTPQHVWRREWQAHPNGALSVARVLVSARDPERQAAIFRRMFGEAAVAPGEGGRLLLPCGPAAVEVAPHAAVRAELGGAAPDPAERGDHMVLIALRVRDLAATGALLRARGIAAAARPGGLRVAAEPALNVTLDFLG